MLAIDQLVAYWNNVRRVTLEFIDVYPPEHLSFRPVESVFTALEQFQHLISSQVMFVRGWTEGTWAFPWQDGRWTSPNLVDESFGTLPGLRDLYSRFHDRAVGFLQSLPDDGGTIVYQTHFGRLSVEAMVLYAIDEEIHHRAQLAIYLRMVGLEPPAFLQRYQDLTDCRRMGPQWVRSSNADCVGCFGGLLTTSVHISLAAISGAQLKHKSVGQRPKAVQSPQKLERH